MARAILLWAAWCSAHAQKPAGDAREVRDDAQPLEGECERWAAEGECEDNPGYMLEACSAACSHVSREPAWGAWAPDTAGWRARLDYRSEQIARIASSQERWDATMNLAVTGLMVKNYTELGYLVVPTPVAVHRLLNETLWSALRSGTVGTEHNVDQISGPAAKFVHLGRAKTDIMRDLLPMHEAWAGVPLLGSNAYGLRLYQPGNTLTMHTDRIETHVISSIVHVDRDVDEPWPIVIEGFDGKTVEVDLQPGQMLFYESAKCVHGRPRPLKGSWFTSLFIHYRPKTWTLRTNDARNFVEPHWTGAAKQPDPAWRALRMRGTGYYEPECENNWCNLGDWPPREPAQGDDDAARLAGDLKAEL